MSYTIDDLVRFIEENKEFFKLFIKSPADKNMQQFVGDYCLEDFMSQCRPILENALTPIEIAQFENAVTAENFTRATDTKSASMFQAQPSVQEILKANPKAVIFFSELLAPFKIIIPEFHNHQKTEGNIDRIGDLLDTYQEQKLDEFTRLADKAVAHLNQSVGRKSYR
ncbi:MAG: hypothetical protein A3E83_04005 [Gammaproteobacteria bacterium RIFCSPHIGHO2_12_FULL_41_20]|nr:MAG: hypothetical protein A3E83_04005 [Gammaproteobacteria bacterium RIFCSPHIGHO2_12_FULL_41_20]